MKDRKDRRERIVSVRLTGAEYERLRAEGKPSEVIRARLRQLVVPATMLPLGTCTTAPNARNVMVWGDGTVGNQWPAPATG